jgi:serine/threonine-protein kinase
VPTSAKHADLGVEIGQVFLGKYRVDAILGQGGMGVVAQCHHLQLDERVAIKMLRPDVLSDQDAVQRFIREAQAAAKLKSEYVARVSDVGSFETGVPYMVMEFLDGLDLGQMLEDGKKTIGVPLAVELGLQACEALCEAHSLGIVHRDVKPTNLFVIWRADKPQVKVLDFGISKSASATDLKLTQTQSLLGTPAYMSPEQMRSARLVDWRSDIWSLGSVYYELLEGRRPFEADSFSEMCVKVAVDAPAPMINTPPALQPVILKCLAKSPDQRYSTMAELARDLIPFVQDQHQGQRLVERMTRMLQRSSHMWDGDSSGAMTPTPSPFPKPPLRASSPVMMAPVAREKSQPVAATPSTLMDTPPKRRGMLIVIGVGMVVGVGIALAVAFGSGEEKTKPQSLLPAFEAKVVQPKVDPPPQPPPTQIEPPKQAGSAVAEVVTTPPPPKDTPKHPPPGAAGKKKPPVSAIKKDEPPVPEVKDPPPPVKDQTVKPPVVKCDPFGSMHGCATDPPK